VATGTAATVGAATAATGAAGAGAAGFGDGVDGAGTAGFGAAIGAGARGVVAPASWAAASCRASAGSQEAWLGSPGAFADSQEASAGSLAAFVDSRGASAGSPAAWDSREDSHPSPWGRSCAADSREEACSQEASAGSPGASAAWRRDADTERRRAAREAAGWDQGSSWISDLRFRISDSPVTRERAGILGCGDEIPASRRH
jgi:hypothetical protein